MCKGYGVVFCFAKSPLPASPSLTHQPVPALWQLSRLSLKRLNRLLPAEIKKTIFYKHSIHNTVHIFLFLLCMQFCFSPFSVHYTRNTQLKRYYSLHPESAVGGRGSGQRRCPASFSCPGSNRCRACAPAAGTGSDSPGTDRCSNCGRYWTESFPAGWH